MQNWMMWLWALLPTLLPIVGAITHGKSTKVFLDNGAGSRTEITSYLTSADLERLRDVAETTVFGVSEKTYLAGIRDKTFSIEGRWDPALHDLLEDDIEDDTTKTVEVAPQGDGSGMVKISFEALIINSSSSLPFDDAGSISAELQGTGAVTRATY